jgi:hypothetical protein
MTKLIRAYGSVKKFGEIKFPGPESATGSWHSTASGSNTFTAVMLQQDQLPYPPNYKAQNCPIPPLSVNDFLYSLERSPTPARFERRHQRLVQGRPRLPRIRFTANAVAKNAMGSEVRVAQDQGAMPPLQAQSIADSDIVEHPRTPHGISIEHFAGAPHLAISHPASTTNVAAEANNESDERGLNSSQPLKKPSLDDTQPIQVCGNQIRKNYEGQEYSLFGNRATGSAKDPM